VAEKIYSKDEAAEYLKISLNTLDRLIAAKKITFSKIGGEKSCRVLFEHADLKAFLAREKKWTIRDSVKEILKLIPPGAKPKTDQLGKFSDLGEFSPVMQLCNNVLEKWQRELDAKNWHEPALFEKMKILFKNVEADRDLCSYGLKEISPVLCEKLAAREINLFETEIKPNLRLAKKYFAPGKLHGVEVIARRATSMPNGVALRSIHVGDDGFPLSETEWKAIPPLSEIEDTNFFNYRYAADIRIALKTKKPMSFRDLQAKTEATDQERADAAVALESDLLTGGE